MPFLNRHIIDKQLARVGLDQPGYRTGQSRFAGTDSTDDAEGRALVKFEVDIV
jgi:hypothetical protein